MSILSFLSVIEVVSVIEVAPCLALGGGGDHSGALLLGLCGVFGVAGPGSAAGSSGGCGACGPIEQGPRGLGRPPHALEREMID